MSCGYSCIESLKVKRPVKHFTCGMVERMEAMQLQLLDVYR